MRHLAYDLKACQLSAGRSTTDNLFETLEVELQDLMNNSKTTGKPQSRVNRLLGLGTHKHMHGVLSWSVGSLVKWHLQRKCWVYRLII